MILTLISLFGCQQEVTIREYVVLELENFRIRGEGLEFPPGAGQAELRELRSSLRILRLPISTTTLFIIPRCFLDRFLVFYLQNRLIFPPNRGCKKMPDFWTWHVRKSSVYIIADWLWRSADHSKSTTIPTLCSEIRNSIIPWVSEE